MDIIVGKNVLGKLKDYLLRKDIRSLYIITDRNVYELYFDSLHKVISNYSFSTHILAPGEKSKSMDALLAIYDDLIKGNIGRDTLIISFGGGVVGDVAGFAASTFKRGLDYIQIPTTLLSQIDSSIGGKVGIDYGGFKNAVGSFYHPILTITDIGFLETLTQREMICGLGEILKYGLIRDYELFEYISSELQKIYLKDEDILLGVIRRSIAIKKEITNKDEYDTGIRKILNFGHTIGHSIEAFYDFNRFNHGEAVILGMLYESYIAKGKGLIEEEYFERIITMLKSLIKPIRFKPDEIDRLTSIMENDKKNIGGNIVFILPTGKGKVDLFNNVNRKEISRCLKGDWI